MNTNKVLRNIMGDRRSKGYSTGSKFCDICEWVDHKKTIATNVLYYEQLGLKGQKIWDDLLGDPARGEQDGFTMDVCQKHNKKFEKYIGV